MVTFIVTSYNSGSSERKQSQFSSSLVIASMVSSTNLSQLAMQKYQLALNEARYTNKVEQLEDAVYQNPFLDSREW